MRVSAFALFLAHILFTMINYRTLAEKDYPEIFRAMDEAFSDYTVKMKMEPDGYRKRLALEGVKFEHSVGAFDGEKMIGATMNAVGYWNGVPTVHDTGTGVIPEYRRSGVSRGMFDFIVPKLKDNGFKRYSLEVIIGNDAAFKLYEGLGFEITREFEIYENRLETALVEIPAELKIKEIEYPDWNELTSFWINEPSWQNSVDCVKRAKNINFKINVLGLYRESLLIGYAVVFAEFGKIAQIAIAEGHRRKGYGKLLLGKLKAYTEKPLLVTNIDVNAVGVIELLKQNGFDKTLSQHEKVLEL